MLAALEGLGRAYTQEGTTEDGVSCLRQALAIYRRIGAPAASRVEETLQHHRQAARGQG